MSFSVCLRKRRQYSGGRRLSCLSFGPFLKFVFFGKVTGLETPVQGASRSLPRLGAISILPRTRKKACDCAKTAGFSQGHCRN